MKKNLKKKKKTSIPNNFFDTSTFAFVLQNVEKKKPLPYVRDIWMHVLLIPELGMLKFTHLGWKFYSKKRINLLKYTILKLYLGC